MRVFYGVMCSAASLLFSTFSHASSWHISVTGEATAQGQAADPRQSSTQVPIQQQLILDEQGHFRNERWSTFAGGITFHFLDVGGATGSASVDLAGWRSGTETQLVSPENARITYADFALLHPNLLLKTASQPSAIDPQGQQTLTDSAQRQVQLQRARNGDIYSAQVAGQLYTYTNWQGVGDARHAGQIQVQRDGKVVRTLTQVNVVPTASTAATWQVPAGYSKAFARNGLQLVNVEGALYRLEGSPSSYQMALIVGTAGILLFDTPRSKEEGAAMRQLLDDKFPGKPVTDIVYSHGHVDHQAGLAAWLDMKPQLWTGQGGRAAIERNVPAAAELIIHELTNPQTLQRGDVTLQLLPVPSLHADDMLLALYPASHAVLQGDLFMVPNQGPVAAYATAAQLQQVLQQANFHAKHIISVHGRVATADDLAQSVALQPVTGLKAAQPQR